MCTYIIHVLYLRLNDKILLASCQKTLKEKGHLPRVVLTEAKKGQQKPSTARVTTKGTGSNKNNIKKKHR